MKLDARTLRRMKSHTPIAILTAYTAPVARCLEQAGLPAILVGDTVAMVEMGLDSTRQVSVEHMCYHIGAVRRGALQTHVIGDMPHASYDTPDSALANAGTLLEAGADSVKLEGAPVAVIEHLVENGVDVVGHTGLTPQTAPDFRQAGSTDEDAARIERDAARIVDAGAFMLVLEHIPAHLAARVTASVAVPTIGIGAGAACDGQVLVVNDAIGLGDYWPPFSRQYAYVGRTITGVAEAFQREVRDGTFVNNILRMRARTR